MKLIKALVALLVVAGLVVPAIAVAEDRLSLSGEMRVRGWHYDTDYDGDDDDSTTTIGDQRLRIGGKIAVAEGVSVTFRTDITESTWGDTGGGNGFGSGRSGASQQWDRAHLDLTFSNGFHLRAGQQFVGTFGTNALDTQDNGLAFDFNPGFKVSGFFIVDNNNGSSSDTLLSGLVVAPEGDNFKSKIFVANQSKGSYAVNQWNSNLEIAEDFGFIDTNEVSLDYRNESVYLIGVSGSTTLGPVNLFAEVDFFTGDSFTVTEFEQVGTELNQIGTDGVGNPIFEVDSDGDLVETPVYAKTGSDDLDAMGTQVFLDASMAATDAFTVGGQFFYASGDDEDIQYTGLGNRFNGWDPIFDVGTKLSNERMDLSDLDFGGVSLNINPFDWTGWNAGSVSGRLYGNFKASDDLSIGASATYLTTEEDDAADADAYALAAGVVYSLLPNTSLQAQVQYLDGTIDGIGGDDIDDDNDFDAFTAGTGLFVTF